MQGIIKVVTNSHSRKSYFSSGNKKTVEYFSEFREGQSFNFFNFGKIQTKTMISLIQHFLSIYQFVEYFSEFCLKKAGTSFLGSHFYNYANILTCFVGCVKESKHRHHNKQASKTSKGNHIHQIKFEKLMKHATEEQSSVFFFVLL